MVAKRWSVVWLVQTVIQVSGGLASVNILDLSGPVVCLFVENLLPITRNHNTNQTGFARRLANYNGIRLWVSNSFSSGD